MTILEVLVLMIVAGVCGALAQSLAGYSPGGCLTTIALGFIGAVLGTWLARQLGLPMLFDVQIGERSFPVLWAIIGAALFVAILGWLSRARRVA